jgi:hypothetical protein
MTLDQARFIINNPGTTPMADWQIAGQMIAKHYRDNPHLLRPVMTHDAKLGALLVQPLTRDEERALRRLGRMRDQAGGVGPRVVARLNGPASAYHIGTDGDGNAVLYCSADIDNAIDPGVISDRRRFTDRARATLAGINQANRAFWDRQAGRR